MAKILLTSIADIKILMKYIYTCVLWFQEFCSKINYFAIFGIFDIIMQKIFNTESYLLVQK